VTSSRRRSSYVTSWAIDDYDECLTTTRGGGRRRKYSWGPAGEHGFRDSIRSASSRSPVSHHECKFLTFQLAHDCFAFRLKIDFEIVNIYIFAFPSGTKKFLSLLLTATKSFLVNIFTNFSIEQTKHFFSFVLENKNRKFFPFFSLQNIKR
jgi:hypothetical protein